MASAGAVVIERQGDAGDAPGDRASVVTAMITNLPKPNIIRVPMAGLKFSEPPAILETLLGSCVGIAVWDERSGYGGLAHAMLADSHGAMGSPGKFVDTAVLDMKRELLEKGANQYSMRAKLAGGAIMFGQNTETVGKANFEAARYHLRQHQIKIMGEHVGGRKGRMIRFSLQDYSLKVEVSQQVVAAI